MPKLFYFSALDVDFGVAGTGANNDVVFGTASVRINGRRAPNYVHVTDTNGYIKIGDNTELKSHVVISGNTIIGKNNSFYPFSNIDLSKFFGSN